MAVDPPFEPQPPFTLPSNEDFLCARFGLPDICSILMPGGFEISSPDVLSLMQPALAPLAPVFAIMETVIAIKSCLEAAVDAITELNPGPLIDCIPGLGRLVDKLLSMLPQTSIPKMAVDLIDCVLGVLLKLRSTLLALQAQAERIGRMVSRAAELDDARLNILAICASDRLADSLSDEMKGLVVIGRLLGIAAGLLDLAGVNVSIPDLGALAGSPLDDVIAPLDDTIEVLQTVRSAIPIPR